MQLLIRCGNNISTFGGYCYCYNNMIWETKRDQSKSLNIKIDQYIFYILNVIEVANFLKCVLFRCTYWWLMPTNGMCSFVMVMLLAFNVSCVNKERILER